MADGAPQLNDPSYGILLGGFSDQDPFFDNTGSINEGLGGLMPMAITTNGAIHLYVEEEATITAAGATHSAETPVVVMGGVVATAGGAGDAYTELSYIPFSFASGGTLLVTDATLAEVVGSNGSTAPTHSVLMGGTDGTNLRGISVSSAGVVNVSDGTTHTDLTSILAALAVIEGDLGPLANLTFDGSGNLNVNVQAGGGGGGGGNASVVIAGTAIDTSSYGTIIWAQYPSGDVAAPLSLDSDGNLLVNDGGGGGGSPFNEPMPSDGVAVGGFDGSGNLVPIAVGDDGALTIDQINGTVNVEQSGTPWSVADQNVGELLWSDGMELFNGAVFSSLDLEQEAIVTLGYDGNTARQFLTDSNGQMKVVVVDMPEVHIDFPDPTNYVDQDLNAAVTRAARPIAPNSLQVTSQPYPLSLPSSSAFGRNMNRPLWTTASGGGLRPLPGAAYYNANATPNNVPYFLTCQAQGAGACVVVTVYNASGTTFAASVCVRVRNTTNGMVGTWQTCPPLTGISTSNVNGSTAILYFNLPVSPGDVLEIDLCSAVGSSVGGVALAAALQAQPAPVSLRPDGRSNPLGTNQVVVNANGTGTSSLVAAPPAGYRILVQGIISSVIGTTNSYLEVNWTVNGSNAPGFLAWAGANVATTASFLPTGGVLLDPATAITGSCGASTTSSTSTIAYDLVPA